MRTQLARLVAALVAAAALSACSGSAQSPTAEPETEAVEGTDQRARPDGPTGVVNLAFAGDMHFQLHLAALLKKGSTGLGPMSRALTGADVAMVNLESAITERGTLERKELETPEDRYHFRAPASALDFLAAAGVDVVSMANNHAADYGTVGLADTLRAARSGPVDVVGVGRNRDAAFASHLETVRGTDIAFLAADASFREGSSSVWEAGPSTPGVAAARSGRPRALLDAVRAASREADVVVVYLHWGQDGRACPTLLQADGCPSARGRRRRRRSWGATPTSCWGRDGRATPTSTTAWATSSGTTTTRPRQGCCGCGSRTARSWATPGCPPRSAPGAGRCR